jgi:hypothetical protein
VAVGAAVVAELVLGAFLVARGGGTPAAPANPNPYRVGEGFPVPPPCSMIDRALVTKIVGSGDHQLTEANRIEDDDPVRTCTFTATKPELGDVSVGMRSRLIGRNGPLEISALGISEYQPTDNLSPDVPKRTLNNVHVNFQIDNLDVGVDYGFPATRDRFLPPPAEAQRMRADVMALTKQIAGRLIPRNKTGPTLPSIPPSTRSARR